MWKCHLFKPDNIVFTALDDRHLREIPVCILGGGVTGIGISAMLWRHDIANIVIDKKHKLGGVWTDEKLVYAGLRLHTPSYYFQYLDDELENEACKKALMASRRTVAEQVDYLVDYARRHELLFLGGVTAGPVSANSVRLERTVDGTAATVDFQWLIDCTTTRLNAGRARQLHNTCTLKPEIQSADRNQRIWVIGGGKSGSDAVCYLDDLGFNNITWVCSRKFGFSNRESMRAEDYLKNIAELHRRLYRRETDHYSTDELLTPHDSINCYKLSTLDSREWQILTKAQKIYGRVRNVSAQGSAYTVNMNDGRAFEADMVINALGVDPAPFIERQMRLQANKDLLLDMIDYGKQVVYVKNTHGEAAVGASLLGLMLAALIGGKIRPDAFRALPRLNVTVAHTGCMVMSNKPLGGDDLLIESHILQLLGLEDQHSFRLLDKGTRRRLLNL